MFIPSILEKFQGLKKKLKKSAICIDLTEVFVSIEAYI